MVLGGGRRDGVEHLAELGEVEGLGEVSERTDGEEAADDAVGGVSREDYHGDGGRDRFGFEFLQDVVSLEVG